MPRSVPILLVLAALTATGCAPPASEEDEDGPALRGEQARVANTVDAFQSAAEQRRDDVGGGGAEAACRRLLARALVARLEASGGCARQVDAALADADPSRLQVQRVRIEGDRAVAETRVSSGPQTERTERYALVREGGTWKLAGFAG